MPTAQAGISSRQPGQHDGHAAAPLTSRSRDILNVTLERLEVDGLVCVKGRDQGSVDSLGHHAAESVGCGGTRRRSVTVILWKRGDGAYR